jgi:putative cardiolipin synthase
MSISIFYGCSHQNLNNTVTDRSISSVEDCRTILDRFLPQSHRYEAKQTIKDNISELNHFAMTKEMKEMDSKVELESTQLFNTFSKEAKDLANIGKFKTLVDPQESLMARVMLIRNAKKTIDLTYYIFQDSDTSKILLNELRVALRRGVNVRLMIDGSGSIKASTNFFREIQVLTHTLGGDIFDDAGNAIGKAKFEAVDINPVFNVRANVKEWYHKVVSLITGKSPPVDDFSIFHRSHDKILLVDAHSPEDSMAIIGGRNISNHYYDIGDKKDRESVFQDLDILIKNVAYKDVGDEREVVKNVLLEHFNRLYYYTANKKFEDFIFKISRDSAAKTLRDMKNVRTEFTRLENTDLYEKLAQMEADDFLNANFDRGYVSFLNEIENLVRKNPLKNLKYNTNHNSVISNLWTQIEKAEKEILICSPYIYLTEKEMDFLVNWLKADSTRTLKIITNSTATSDNIFAQAMVESFVMPKLIEKLKLAEINKKQFELLAYGNLANKKLGGNSVQGSIHAKFWMIDNYSVGIGTSNIDPISRLTNSEIVANVFSLEGNQTTKSVLNYYTSLKNQSTHWGEVQFMQAKYHPELKVKIAMQSFVAKVMRLFKLLPQD